MEPPVASLDVDAQIYNALIAVFGALMAAWTVAFEPGPGSGSFGVSSWAMLVGGVGMFAGGALALAFPHRIGPDEVSRWQVAVLGVGLLLLVAGFAVEALAAV